VSIRSVSHISEKESVEKVDTGRQNPQPSLLPAPIEVLYIPNGEKSMRRLRDEVETKVILRTLQHTGWNRKQAAALLKISYRGLLYKISRNSITPTSGR
jgi:DNA-binding NtrC family response regulator